MRRSLPFVRAVFALSLLVSGVPCVEAQQHSTLNALMRAQGATTRALRVPGERTGSGLGIAAVGGRALSPGAAPVTHPPRITPTGRRK